MGFLKSLKSKKKLSVLVKGSSRKKSKVLYTAAKNVKLDKRSKLDGVRLYSFTNTISSSNEEEFGHGNDNDNATIRTDINTSSERSSSSRALSDSLYDIEFREILHIGSADSYFSTSLSSISLDGRDDSHCTGTLLEHSHSEEEGHDSNGSDNGNEDEDSRDTAETPNKNLIKDSDDDGGGKPPQSPTSITTTTTDYSSTKSQSSSSSSTSSCTKALKLKELRRTASNDSKNYVHVFHNQLTTLEEQPSKEEDYGSDGYSSDSSDSSDNECIYGIGQRHSFMASFDEYELRMRWNHSLQAMAKRGLLSVEQVEQQQQDRDTEEDSCDCGHYFGHDTPIRDGEGEI